LSFALCWQIEVMKMELSYTRVSQQAPQSADGDEDAKGKGGGKGDKKDKAEPRYLVPESPLRAALTLTTLEGDASLAPLRTFEPAVSVALFLTLEGLAAHRGLWLTCIRSCLLLRCAGVCPAHRV
jgi:hypothetical protein